jgi:hypothetical protein
MARTAVIAGTATAVSNKVSQHQANKAYEQAEAQAYEAQQAAPPPPPPAPAGGQDDVVAQIQQLAQLKDQGILTEEEFAAKKAQLLGI